MLNLSNQATLVISYTNFLAQNNIAKIDEPFYLKWFRFYLDFCQKYSHKSEDPISLPNFIDKLRAKKQSDANCHQAKHAVSLYYNLINGQVPNPVKRELNVKISRNQSESIPQSTSKAPSEMPLWDRAFIQLKQEIELRHYSKNTFQTYFIWTRKFARFSLPKNPGDITDDAMRKYLTYLTNGLKVSASTQRQAFNALLFFFRHVLNMEPGDLSNTPRPKRRPYIPSVLSMDEIATLIGLMRYPFNLMAKVMYGCGLRLSECTNIRVQDMNFDTKILTVHRGKGGKDRTLPLPDAIITELKSHLTRVKNLHGLDLKNAFDGVFMPESFDKKAKYAGQEFNWYWLFPARSLTITEDKKEKRRYHQHDTNFQKAIKEASRKAQIPKRISPHTLRHSFATHLLQAGYDIRTIQELLGHSDVRTTMIYTHTIKREVKEIISPLDLLADRQVKIRTLRLSKGEL
jgi:integron integrase